jgi:predicted RNase H-like nuclease (RuvC/YqgF family)
VLRAAIETGVGLTAAKLMVGKAVAKSDETYIAKAKLDDAFQKLSKYLNVTGVEAPLQQELTKTIVKQQQEIADLKENVEDLTRRLDVMTEELEKLDIRIRYQPRSFPTEQLTDQEIEEISKREKKRNKELRKHDLVEQE